MSKIKIELGKPTFRIADKKFKEELSQKRQKGIPINCFDFSMLNVFLNCHRYYYYRHELNIAVLGQTAPPLVMGGAIHNALKNHHNLLMNNGQGPGYRYDYEQHAYAAKLGFAEHVKPYLIDNSFPITKEQSDGKRYATRGLDILEAYLKHYPYEDFVFEGVELPIALIMPYQYENETGEVIYIGMVDGVIFWRGKYYILETKTASRIDRYYFPTFKLSFQVIGYINAIRELKGLDIDRALINVIGVYVKDYKFERDTVIKQEEEIESFQEQIISITREIFWYRSRVALGEQPENVWYQNPSYCFKWNRACQFHPLCSKPTSQGRKMLADVMYGRDVWSPFEIYGAEI